MMSTSPATLLTPTQVPPVPDVQQQCHSDHTSPSNNSAELDLDLGLDLGLDLERTPRAATAVSAPGGTQTPHDHMRKSKLSTSSATSTQFSLTPTKSHPFPPTPHRDIRALGADKVQMGRRDRSSRRSNATLSSSNDHHHYNLYGRPGLDSVQVDDDDEFGGGDDGFFGSSIPTELCEASSPRVTEFLHQLADAMLLIKPTLEAFVDEAVDEGDPMLPHLVAAEADVALYSLFHDDHDDWTVAEVIELLDNAHQLVLATLAFPELCAAVILPQLRNAFPLPVFAQALLDWTLPRRSSVSPTQTPTARPDSQAAYDLANPLLLTFLVGRGNKPADLMLVGELSATVTRLVLDTPTSPYASLTLQEARYTHPWTAPFPPLALHLFRSVLHLAAGHNPLCVAMVLAGLFEALCTVDDMAHLLVALYPRIDPEYETVHGDLALMLRQLAMLPLSPVTDFARFFAQVLSAYGPQAHDVAVFFGLTVPAVDDGNAHVAMYKHNALRQGSAPYHVRLALDLVRPVHRAPAALSMFRFAYENPLHLGLRYKLSGRVNEWRVVDTPRLAMEKVAKVVGGYASPVPSEAPVDDDPQFLDHMFGALSELEFGFVEPNDMDEAEHAGDTHEADADEADTLDKVDLTVRGVGLSSMTGVDAGDKDDDALDADEDPDAWYARASAVLHAMDHGQDLDGDVLGEDAPEPQVDDDFVRMCLAQIEAADGDLDAVDIEGLVDELLTRSRVPLGVDESDHVVSHPK